MKKFLSLVLALIMTMSLVTISAGAAEYKDFTDKDEIQYEEAVAVLNRLGIITGYSEGDFRPEGELTRGAAAKIIASLLLGPDAANNLSPSAAPFKDVPLDHTFAGPISYCSNLKIINGYSDGSFQPGGTLTGYAFSKMLLGALGYDGNREGFTGAGWNMNVMRLGGEAGLFDRISFKGNDPVNREQAAQLALNTLKGTLVEYTGGVNITTGDSTVSVNSTRIYKTSNQEYATHILNKKATEQGSVSTTDALWTVEFGEEHFVDLRMSHDRNTYDDFGRPSNEWSYKKVTIGTFPIEPDFVYTTQVTHNVDTVTPATKERALGLNGFEVTADAGTNVDHKTTHVYVNGVLQNGISRPADIADYTDNGTLVEVYVSDQDADFIENVVVVKTQLMEIKRIGSDYVSLELHDDNSDAKADAKADASVAATKGVLYGYNQDPIDVNVNNVEVNDDCYTQLSGMKAGDLVAVIPQSDDGVGNYDVARVYVPETVSGSLDRVDTYGTVSKGPNATSVTVGGTEYKIALWNKNLYDIDSDTIKVTNKDIKVYLDEYGNALKAEDVGATTNFMVVGNYRQGLVNGQIITYMNGWDINGKELSLNVGAVKSLDQWKRYAPVGSLLRYTSDASSNTAEWAVDYFGVFDVDHTYDSNKYELKTSNTRIRLADYMLEKDSVLAATERDKTNATGATDTAVWADSGIKFIYVSVDNDGEIDSIEFKSGMQSATNDELSGKNAQETFKNANNEVAQACVSLKSNNTEVKGDSAVKAVVIKTDSSDASVNNLLYIARYHGSATRDEKGNVIQGYEVAMMNEKGELEEDVVIYSDKSLKIGQFARYTKTTHDEERFDPFYNLKAYAEVQRAASVAQATIDTYARVNSNNTAVSGQNKNFVYLKNITKYSGSTTAGDVAIKGTYAEDRYLFDGDTSAANLVDMRNAHFYDLTTYKIDSASDMFDVIKDYEDDHPGRTLKIDVALIFNDKVTHDDFRCAYAVIITRAEDVAKSGSSSSVDYGTMGTTEINGTSVTRNYKTNSSGEVIVTVDVTKPSWVPESATLKYGFVGTVDGVKDTSRQEVANRERSESFVLAGVPKADSDSVITGVLNGLTWTQVNLNTAGDAAGVTANVNKVNVGEVTSVNVTFAANAYKDTSTIAVKQGSKTLSTISLSSVQVAAGAATITVPATVDATSAVTLEFTMVPNKKTVVPTLGIDEFGKNTTGVGVGTPESSVSSDKWVAEVKGLDAGMYQFDNSIQSGMGSGNALWYGGAKVDAKDCIVFVFEKSGQVEEYTIQITDQAGKVMYTESFHAVANDTTNSFFNLQVNDNKSLDFFNSTRSMPMSDNALPAGTYNWSVKGSLSGTVADGSFEIKKDNWVGDVTPAPIEVTDPPTEGDTEPTATEKANSYKNQIMDQPTGVYVFPAVDKSIINGEGASAGLAINGETTDNRVWTFENKQKENVTLTLYDTDGTTLKHRETYEFNAGKHFFFIQVTGENMNNTNQGTCLSQPLSRGSYLYRIVGATSGVITQGYLNID